MDPRIQWVDILMRLEIPNRTEDSERKLMNSTNNLINRKDHPQFRMLSWHSTGINGMNGNEGRTLVLDMVAASDPPLPFRNSTRGLTPGLIDPLGGNVPGNIVPLPVLRNGMGRLRVVHQQSATAAAVAQAQSNEGPRTRGQSNRLPEKRRHSSQEEDEGRPPKHKTQNPNGNDDIDTRSDGSLSSGVRIDTAKLLLNLLTCFRRSRSPKRPALNEPELEKLWENHRVALSRQQSRRKLNLQRRPRIRLRIRSKMTPLIPRSPEPPNLTLTQNKTREEIH